MHEEHVHVHFHIGVSTMNFLQRISEDVRHTMNTAKETMDATLALLGVVETKIDGLKDLAVSLPGLFKQSIDDALAAVGTDATLADLANALQVKANELGVHVDDAISAFNTATTPADPTDPNVPATSTGTGDASTSATVDPLEA